MSRLMLLLLVSLTGAAGLGAMFLDWKLASGLLFTLAALPSAVLVLVSAIRSLRGGKLGVDIIALIAIAGAIALGAPGTAALIALMVASGEALEEMAEARARRTLTALISRAPRQAHRETGGVLTDIEVSAIASGDVLLVKAGETLPVDGTLLEPASIDEQALTGEPIAVTREIGTAVRSGGVNAGGPFRLTAGATAESSTFAAIIRLVHEAEGERAPMVRLADRWALWFLPFTLAVAGAAWAITGSADRALAVMVVATPCPLILAAPVALICGISRAAAQGVIVKGGGALERLARATTALFDKTGTLTSGTPQVSGVVATEGYDADAALRLAASLDQTSQHVVARAIVAAATQKALGGAGPALSMPTDVVEIAGGGLTGRIDGQEITVGSASLMTAHGFVLPDSGPAARLAAAAASVSWVGIDGKIAAAILLADRLRPEAARAIRDLRAAGVGRIVMVTGDRLAAAQAVGATLGLDAVFADLDPAGKIAVLKDERARGPVVMVGDGINDAPVLAAADIGIAMGARGAAAAAEAADVVVLVDRIDRIAPALVAARRARHIALQSVAAGMGLSAIAMAVAAAGYLPPVAGALLQEAIDAGVILNALRVLAGAGRSQLPETARVGQVMDDHADLRALIATMRQTADGLQAGEAIAQDRLDAIAITLRDLLLPHQAEEEKTTYPALAQRLGGQDPLGPLSRMHEDIADLATRFMALTDGRPDSPHEAREAARLLHVMEAMLALHLAAEEELLAEAGEAA